MKACVSKGRKNQVIKWTDSEDCYGGKIITVFGKKQQNFINIILKYYWNDP